MTVYVDSMRAKYGRMVMCHMVADTTEELLQMADAIGVNRKWLQYPSTYKEHFDIALTKRAKAIANGAVEITQQQLGAFLKAKREAVTQQKGDGNMSSVGEQHVNNFSEN